MKILIVEDEPSLCEMMQKSLEAERYVVVSAGTFDEAAERIAEYSYDCILLDIMLPGGNGLELLRRLKDARKDAGVIIISARDALDDKIAGLELGADDYLAKPFHLAELSARIRSLMRRRQGEGELTFSFGNITIRPDSLHVTVGETEVPLLRKEYDILSYFVRHPGHLVDKTTLAEAVWGDHIDQADSFDFVYAQVKNVRKKLRQSGATAEIRSVYGFGYKMVMSE